MAEDMKEKAYYENQDIKNDLKLREMLKDLPPVCKQFFIGIEPTTSSRTRIAYAYDLSCFFDYLLHNNNTMNLEELSIKFMVFI